jgi:hypothetical protein
MRQCNSRTICVIGGARHICSRMRWSQRSNLMRLTLFPNRRAGLPLLCLIAAVVVTPAMPAQTPSDQAKAAGAIPLTLELLDKIDKLTKAVSSDAATNAEWNSSSKDWAISSGAPSALIISKYPKLAAAFKAAGLAPEDFGRAFGAIMAAGMIAELGIPMEEKNAAANVAFCKANKDRVLATMNSLESLDTDADTSSPSAPSTSPASSP